MISGTVLSIDRCSLHDGPGLRTTVFLKGCPLSCLWCHNPESQSFKPELYYFDEKCVRCGLCAAVCPNHIVSGTEHSINRADCNACGRCVSACLQSALEIKGIVMSAQDVIAVALKDVRYYKQSGGGLTLSGGEPLAQFDFSLELLRLAKENSLHTCIETSGYAPAGRLLSLVPYIDLFLYDFKESNDDIHKKVTGVSRNLIMDNLFAIDKAGAKIALRCPIVPDRNDREDHFQAIAALANSLENIIEINLELYHPLGISKCENFGLECKYQNSKFTDKSLGMDVAEYIRNFT
ncbi:MAG: glycyl-radical enzyme activating protein, partial [Treponema sp.]|nr:glycyl-radical enzyme activating protein [Treponema sp.]